MVTLPRGLLGDGRRVDAAVRGLTGRDEELLVARSVAGAAVAETATDLLVRCVSSLGGDAPTVESIRELSVGDREALMLHVRRETLGDRVDCVATCPDPSCRAQLDLTLSVERLLVGRLTDARAWYDESFDSPAGQAIRARFRVPTGGDQEAAAALAATDPAAAARLLLERCVEVVSSVDGEPLDLDEHLADALAARMADLDAQAEIRLLFDCDACGRPVEVLFDTASFFLAEIAATADRLYDEVHAIAWHYHWSEAEILDLSRSKRHGYLDRIAGSLSPRQARSVA